MRTCAFAVLLVLFCSTFAAAQIEEELFEVPNTELYGGYAYQHTGLDGFANATGAPLTQDSTGLQGFAVEFRRYFWKNVGVAVDVSWGTNGQVDVTGIQYRHSSYVGGPAVRVHRFGFFSTAVHAMAGVDRSTLKVPYPGTSVNYHDTDFAILAGGTLDGNLSRHIGVRLAQVDYVYTHHYGTGQSGFRYSGGLVVRF